MEYTVIFDVTQAGYRQGWFPAVGLIFVFVGVLAIRYKRLFRHGRVFGAYFFFGFSIFWTLFAFVATYADYHLLSAALRESRCEMVEGVVTNFQRMPAIESQKKESFIVGGRRFEYSNYNVTAGYNQMQSHGGAVRQADRVRIHHLDGKIARLEIAD